jgi:hypothetical protein
MNKDGKIGFFLVESTRACFPLVLYPDSHSTQNSKKNKTRASALRTALGKVMKNHSAIFSEMEKHEGWTLELERELEKHFEYQANDNKLSENMKKTG